MYQPQGVLHWSILPKTLVVLESYIQQALNQVQPVNGQVFSPVTVLLEIQSPQIGKRGNWFLFVQILEVIEGSSELRIGVQMV